MFKILIFGMLLTTVFSMPVNAKEIKAVLDKQLYSKLELPQYGDIEIEGTYSYDGDEYKIVEIGEALFAGNTNITKVVLPDTVKKIGAFAFDRCSALKEVVIPEGVQIIGRAAFQMCTSLEHIELPDSIEEIRGFGFNHCSKVKNSTVRLPRNLKLLGDKYDAPAHMFYDFADDSCSEFVIDESNDYYTTSDGVLYTKDGHTLVSIPEKKRFGYGVYNIPNSVSNLGELSFGRNKNIECIILSDNLKVDASLNDDELHCYKNHGNDLSRACYIYGNVKKYAVKATNKKYKAVRGILYSIDGKHLVAVPNEYSGEIKIPKGTEYWDEEAMWSEVMSDELSKSDLLGEIRKVKIPASMKYIPDKQLATLNYLHEKTGTEIIVDPDNIYFCTGEDGTLRASEIGRYVLASSSAKS